MPNAEERLLATPAGRTLLNRAEKTIFSHGMLPALRRGTLVGFSGGADSVALLLLLWHISAGGREFPLLAVHLNHGIRGEEASRDARFCEDFCQASGIPFLLVCRDVPTYAEEHDMGLEEAAREVRYSVFQDIIHGRDDLAVIAVAHHATDNLETVLFHMMRGSGTAGLCGMAPVSGNILRPLLEIPADTIRAALAEAQIPFVTDSTNLSDVATRNYIRHEILPRLTHLTPSPESAVFRLCRNLRADDDALSHIAETFMENYPSGEVPVTALATLDEAIFFRVLKRMAEAVPGPSLGDVNVRDIYRLVREKSDAFSVSVPGQRTFVCNGLTGAFRAASIVTEPQPQPLFLCGGWCEAPAFGCRFLLTEEKTEISSNIHKKSIQADLSSAIIVGKLQVRHRLPADAYRIGGMTRQLKKLLTDRKVPPAYRGMVPVVCDDKGVVWVPGFGVREDVPQGGASGGGPYLLCVFTTSPVDTLLTKRKKGLVI